MTSSVAAVVDALRVRECGPDTYTGDSIRMGLPRVFGGQVLGQCLVAAARTAPPGAAAHSLHGYFLRAGDPDQPIEFTVERVREGRRLCVRSVTARQGGRALVTATVSLTNPGVDVAGVEHALPMPAARQPDLLPTLAEHAGKFGGLSESWSGLDAIDCRVDPQAQHLIWLRLAGPVDDDPLLHQALQVYLSDVTLLAAALLEHDVPMGIEVTRGRRWDGISLDHAIWFHRAARADGWLLFAHSSPSAAAGRALVRAECYDLAGTLAASVAQEGLFLFEDAPDAPHAPDARA